MKKSFLIKMVFFFSLAFAQCVYAFSQQKELSENISLLNQAFINKNVGEIKTILSKDFSVSTYTGNSALFSLNAILKNYRIDSLIIKNISKKDSLLVVDIRILGGSDSSTQFFFNKEYKLLRSDLFDKLYGLDRNKPALKVATIPFEVENGFIYFIITLNDRKEKLRFLFDTGSDGMMVDTKLAEKLGLKTSREQSATAVGGHIDIKVSENNIVHFGDFDLNQQSIAVFGNTNPNHDGIIGNSILKRYITHIDYDKKEMVLYSLGEFNDKSDAAKRIPIDVSTGNILFSATLNLSEDKPVLGEFTFDTGAGYHLIVFRPTVLKYKMLVDGFEPDSMSTTVSMGMSTPVFHGKANKLSFSKKWSINNFPVTLMGKSATTSEWNPNADGSLGVHFISNYNFTVNLVDKYITFENRTNKIED